MPPGPWLILTGLYFNDMRLPLQLNNMAIIPTRREKLLDFTSILGNAI